MSPSSVRYIFAFYILHSVILLVKSYNSTCTGPIQSKLLYNVDKYTAADVGLPNGSKDELLSDAICCDYQYRNYAEPNGFFKFYDIGLFRKVDSNNITVFYDTVCGIPLFQAPIGRTFDQWIEDTNEHGWPSFRSSEIISSNVKFVNSTTNSFILIYSLCGTYLGSYSPDDKGERYCIDLSCISGNPIIV